MIISSINGRLRYRASWLKHHSQLELLTQQLQSEDAVTQVAANPQTGSLLVCYDHRLTSKDQLEQKIMAYATELNSAAEAQKNKPKDASNNDQNSEQELAISASQAIKFGMLGTLIPSMIWAAVGSKKLHILSGGGFLLFVAMHMFGYRENLLK